MVSLLTNKQIDEKIRKLEAQLVSPIRPRDRASAELYLKMLRAEKDRRLKK